MCLARKRYPEAAQSTAVEGSEMEGEVRGGEEMYREDSTSDRQTS